MTASVIVIGHAISPAPGGWLRPPVPSGAGFTAGDAIPIASLAGGQAEMTALINTGNATQVAG